MLPRPLFPLSCAPPSTLSQRITCLESILLIWSTHKHHRVFLCRRKDKGRKAAAALVADSKQASLWWPCSLHKGDSASQASTVHSPRLPCRFTCQCNSWKICKELSRWTPKHIFQLVFYEAGRGRIQLTNWKGLHRSPNFSASSSFKVKLVGPFQWKKIRPFSSLGTF